MRGDPKGRNPPAPARESGSFTSAFASIERTAKAKETDMSQMASDMIWMRTQHGSLIELLIREYANNLIQFGCEPRGSGC